MKFLKSLCLFCLLIFSCKSSEEFTGFSYDPPNVTDTQGRDITFQKKRVIGAGNPKVWVSNEFEGARASSFYAVSDSLFEIYIEPENQPINNSPWFAFKIWSDSERIISLRLNYKEARHRYVPKIHTSSGLKAIDMNRAVYDTASNTLTFSIQLTEVPIMVSAQEVTDNEWFEEWLSMLLEKSFVTMKQVGESNLRNPIQEVTISEVEEGNKAGVLLLMSRQHPPEVSGFLASQYFMEEFVNDSELSKKFRSSFVVKAYPMINPDGVYNGHWRHNARGVDLNRDWQNFNQPETRAVRDALLPLKNRNDRQVFYGIDFHSTNENIFYPINREVVTKPDNFTQRWFTEVTKDNPNVPFTAEEFDTSSPISKNWVYKTFGADAVTFEVDDELDRDKVESMSRSAAQSLMRLLLEELE